MVIGWVAGGRAPNKDIQRHSGGLGSKPQVIKVYSSYSKVCESPGVAEVTGTSPVRGTITSYTIISLYHLRWKITRDSRIVHNY